MTATPDGALRDALAHAGVRGTVEWRGRVALVRLQRAEDVARCAADAVREALLAAARADGAVTCAVTLSGAPAVAE